MKVFGKLENKFIELCTQCPPNIEAIKEKLADGVDVNAFDGDEPVKTSLLSAIIYRLGWKEDNGSTEKYGCRHMCDVIRIILDAGFDVSLDEGRYGAMALLHLIFCYTDEYILDAARMLLAAGADPRIAPYVDAPCEDVIEDVMFDASVRFHDGDYEEAKILFHLAEILKKSVSLRSNL